MHASPTTCTGILSINLPAKLWDVRVDKHTKGNRLKIFPAFPSSTYVSSAGRSVFIHEHGNAWMSSGIYISQYYHLNQIHSVVLSFLRLFYCHIMPILQKVWQFSGHRVSIFQSVLLKFKSQVFPYLFQNLSRTVTHTHTHTHTSKLLYFILRVIIIKCDTLHRQ